MYVSPETLKLIFELGIEPDKLVRLFQALDRDALSVAPAATNEERERLRNESTYAERKRAKDRERQRRLREEARQSRDVAGDRATSTATEGDEPATTSDPAPRTCAQVDQPTSSLRSEGTSEAKASSVNASSDDGTPADPEKPKTKPPKSGRGTRLPEDWEPSDADVEVARAEGLTDEEIQRAALEFRNYWCARSRDATKLSWPRTWHNRIIDIADRKRKLGARLAAAPNQPGGHRRGPVSFADIYARRHGQAAE